MPEIFLHLFADLRAEAVGLIGGAIFLGSWMLQAWESRLHGTPVVSGRFFALRAVACALLTYEGYRTGSLSVVVVMLSTMVLMLYNLLLLRRGRR
ncbi:hypothetical protein [Ostreiculturibacter nitratireducens]|uniref:hypothetical protein n=1 Tax=Ostreiculturibacter nitratireducens TaxID=3075226 RepID=UPI0031B62F19